MLATRTASIVRNDAPRISICIPTFNRGDLLRQTLDVLLPQLEGRDVELLISDNASTDNTPTIVHSLKARHPFIRYHRQSENVGLDNNTLASIATARGEYCWLCSDDDIPLPGSFAKIEDTLRQYSPNLIYLHHEGYLENEDFRVVYSRIADTEDVVYHDGELMLRHHLLNHLSSIVVRRSAAIQFFDAVGEHNALGLERGYSLIVAPYIALKTQGPFVYVGRLCVAVRNPLNGNNYNPLTILTDVAANYQLLARKGLIKEATERAVLNGYVRTFYKLVLPLRLKRDPYFTDAWRDLAIARCKKYGPFYWSLYPALVLPRWIVFVPYKLGTLIKRTFRKHFNRAPF